MAFSSSVQTRELEQLIGDLNLYSVNYPVISVSLIEQVYMIHWPDDQQGQHDQHIHHGKQS